LPTLVVFFDPISIFYIFSIPYLMTAVVVLFITCPALSAAKRSDIKILPR